MAVEDDLGDAGGDPGVEAFAEGQNARGLGVAFLQGEGGGRAEADDRGDGERAGAESALVAAAVDEGGEADLGVAAADVEGADPLGAVELVGGKGHQVELVVVHVDREAADGLGGVGVEEELRSWQSRPMAAVGLIVPTSLLAAMIETRTVRSVIAASTDSAETWPVDVGGRKVTSQPSRARRRRGSSTARCSAAEVMMWLPFFLRWGREPLRARLFDSVAPEVKTISFGSAPIRVGDLLAGRLDGGLGVPAEAVGDAGGVAVNLGEIGQHRRDDAGVGAGRGVVVEIDGRGEHVRGPQESRERSWCSVGRVGGGKEGGSQGTQGLPKSGQGFDSARARAKVANRTGFRT